jgi:hypothetical protein
MVNKRERSSPGETISEKRNRPGVTTSEKKSESINMPGLLPIQDDEFMDAKEPMDTIFMDILKKDDETYLGTDVNDKDAIEIWEQVFKLNRSLIFGVALIKNKERTLSISIRLHKPMMIPDGISTFEFTLRGATFRGKLLLPLGPPPKLGEAVFVKVRKTAFKLKDEEIIKWLNLYGEVQGHIVYEDSEIVPSIKTDTLSVRMVLRRHIPSLLPAYGRKMSVVYRGQPILCGACYQIGHVRAKCGASERVDWMTYVKDFIRQGIASRDMLGRWADYAEQ